MTNDDPGAVGRLPDPLPEGREPEDGVWWPAAMLEAAWLDAHADEIDVVHLHFGFEGRTPEQLQEWLDTVRRHELPLVLTVHDLDNPHLEDQEAHLAALDLLVPAADVVLTLTTGAAAQIRDRWGVDAAVVPHPQIAPDHDVLATAAVPRDRRPRVGVPLGAVRANVDPLPWLAALAEATDACGADLEVVVNDEVLEAGGRPAEVLDAVRRIVAGHPAATLSVLPRMSDEELHRWVGETDVVALPYRHGTHSGWLELCWDLGASVLAPRVGHYADQHRDQGFLAELDAPTVSAALPALLAARRDGCPWGSPEERLALRRGTGEQAQVLHRTVYQRARSPRTVQVGA